MNAATSAPAKRSHIYAIDFVRLFVIAAVISVHISATGQFYNSNTSGIVWMLFHTSREAFFFLTALVLSYGYGPGRRFKWSSFYKRRFGFILAPYAIWTAIYLQLNHAFSVNLVRSLETYGHALMSASAAYHLYFLVVTMQLYILFPLVRRLIVATEGYHRWLMGVSLIVELGFMTISHYLAPTQGILGYLVKHEAISVFTYQAYLMAGALAAWHLPALLGVMRRSSHKIYGAGLAIYAAGLGSYAIERALGQTAERAADTFQPLMVFESFAFIAMLFAAGTAWERRGARNNRFVYAVSQNSFGIYLSHLYILTKLSPLQPAGNTWPAVVGSLVIGVPLIYGIAFSLTELLRRTPLSLFLTGRVWNRSTWHHISKLLRKPTVTASS